MYTSTRTPRIIEPEDEITVLHVDDEPDIAELVTDYLQREDNRIEVQTATSVRDGLEYLSETEVECVISDYDMPRQNGIEFLETVREEHPNLPFILYTGKGSEEIAADAISAGVTDYLQKDRGTDQYTILANRVLNAVENYRAVEHLERQNDLFAKAQDIANVGAWEYDVETDTYYNTEQVLAIHGIPPDANVDAVTSLEHVHPDDRPEFREVFQQAVDAGTEFDLELRLNEGDGNPQWVRTRGEPQVEDEDIVRVRGAIQDITDRKEREQNLERFKKVAENAGHAVYVTDCDGTIEYVNPAFEQITGYGAEDAVGKNPRILKSGEMPDEYYTELWETVLAGEIWKEDVINRRENGDRYHAHQTIAPVLDENDDIEAFVAIQTDITERKEKTERLESFEALNQTLTELSIDLLQSQETDIDAKIDTGLEKIGTLVGADRSYVFQIHQEDDTLSNTHEWCADGIKPQIDMLNHVDLDTFSWLLPKLRAGENVKIPDISDLPQEAAELQHVLREQNIQSLVIAPMRANGTLVGFIGFDWVQEHEQWSIECADMLRMAGQLISSALTRTEREVKIRRLKERLGLAVQAANIGVWDWDVRTGTVHWDESMERLLGLEPGTFEGTFAAFRDRVHPEDLDRIESEIESALETGDDTTYTLRLETNAGEYSWLETRLRVIQDAHEQPDRAIGVAIDITERKEREQKLAALTDRYRDFVEYSSDILTVTDKQGTITFESPAVERVLGYNIESRIGDNVFEYVHPEDREDATARFEAIVKQPSTTTERAEFRFEHADGSYRWLESIGVDRTDSEIDGIVFYSRDISARKDRERRLEQRNQDLKEREAQFKIVLSAGERLMEATSREEATEIAIDAAKNILGYARATFRLVDDNEDYLRVYASTKDIVAAAGTRPDYRVDEDVPAARTYRRQAPEIHHDLNDINDEYDRGTLRSGLYAPVGNHGVFSCGNPEPDVYDETDVHVLEVLMNLTSTVLTRIEYERELRQKKDQVEKFASIVSHDLRNPLNVAIGHVELAHGDCDTSHLDRIETSLERIETIIDETLTLSRLGKTVEVKQEIDLTEQVTQSWDGVETGRSTLDPPSERVRIRADPERLKQVFENLFRNAIEHGGEGVTVSIDLSADGFAVADDGEGLPADIDVFEPGVTTSSDGTGFGLPIVNEIVTAHGWEIQATESEAGGARFEITGVESIAK